LIAIDIKYPHDRFDCGLLNLAMRLTELEPVVESEAIWKMENEKAATRNRSRIGRESVRNHDEGKSNDLSARGAYRAARSERFEISKREPIYEHE